MHPVRKLPAKVLKRIGQVSRLGPRGLAHTAYVRTLGPTVYSLTEPARIAAARFHRQRALNRDLGWRLQRLKQRTAAIGADARGGIRKDFGADAPCFLLSLEAMLDLGLAGCAVPRIIGIDWSANTFVQEEVEGRSLSRPLDESSIALLEEALLAIHRAGYFLGEIGTDGVAFGPGGRPVIRDLGHAIPLAGLSRDLSVHLRDADRHRFNRLFGTRLLTASELRKSLSPSATIPRDMVRDKFAEVYAPVVLRDDIRWGKIWNTDLGTGRWNFIMKRNLPIPVGGSVLDLGSNNGFNPLQMLRGGAASAVGIELEATEIEQSTFLKAAYEWLDNKSYDFRCIHGSQGDLASFGLGRFDMVTAFCSLYYLPAAQIRHLVRHIRTMTDLFVVQCNTDRLIDRGGDEEVFRKASLPFALEMLEQAGFTNRQVIAPPGYSRPLVIARP
jgi:hypothetical protein